MIPSKMRGNSMRRTNAVPRTIAPWRLKPRPEIDSPKPFIRGPKISIITPVYNSSVDFLRDAAKSVFSQKYKNWEWCICDDASSESNVKAFLETMKRRPNVRVQRLEQHQGIVGALNTAASMATGEVLSFLDSDDELDENALFEVSEVFINYNMDLVYTDEALKRMDKNIVVPHHKPNYSPHYLLATNYICHLLSIRRALFNELGGFREGFDGSQDHDLILRIVNNSTRVFHIPKVLYYWRVHKNSFSRTSSTLAQAIHSGKRAVSDALGRKNTQAIITNEFGTTHYKVKPVVRRLPKVSIIIPTKSVNGKLQSCIDSIMKRTTYLNFEIVVK
jgi:glycosyltransferase involved in cell wall biosynthesis